MPFSQEFRQNQLPVPIRSTNKNRFIPIDYLSIFRPITIDSVMHNQQNTKMRPSIDSSFRTGSLSEFPDESLTVFKINIPIEMLIRTIPQTASSPVQFQEPYRHNCSRPRDANFSTNVPHQSWSDWTVKPAASLIRRVQQAIFGSVHDQDRGDINMVPTGISSESSSIRTRSPFTDGFYQPNPQYYDASNNRFYVQYSQPIHPKRCERTSNTYSTH